MEKNSEQIKRTIESIELLKKEIEFLKCDTDQCKKSIYTIMGNLNHEVRTPLNGIVGFSEILNTTTLSPEETKLYTGVIEESSMMLLSIINDVMEIVKIETGHYTFEIEPFDLNDLFFNVYMDYRDRAESKGLQLFLQNLVSEPFIINSSNNAIKRVLEKLVDNAIKFTREGWIKLSYKVQDEYIVFKVEDTGIGIPKLIRENLFTRFIHEEVSKSRKVSGTGLDLTLCNCLVNLMGGSIHHLPGSEQGSIFKFTILNHKR